jgi:pyruvate/2-oxoglutarate dehydrogenase complex dihydrolipoamide dehydrogenase (E3) component
MSVDYDLLVIGNSAAGIYAAVRAASLKARVALVDQQISLADSPDSVSDRVLAEVGAVIENIRRAAKLGIFKAPDQAVEFPLVMEQATRWTTAVTSALEAMQSPAVLSALGIEVIAGCGEFYRKPSLGFVVNGRSLRSRAYLIAAIPFRPILPDIYDLRELQAIDYITASHPLQPLAKRKYPGSLVIIGADPKGVELAQTFVKLGFQVTLIVRSSQILPQEDPEAAYLIQAQLEAEGVEVLTRTTITQIKQIQGKKWVQTTAWQPEPGESTQNSGFAGNLAIEADEILLATGYAPDLAALNLEAAGVTLNEHQELTVNQKLQTSNSRVYVCTDLKDRYSAPQVEIRRAKVAVNNALFFPISRFSDQTIPRIVCSNPELARIGLNEPQAIARYGKDVWILRQYFKTLPKAQIQGTPTGFCKLIVRRNGEILGAHLVGPQATELIGPIALIMQQNLKVQTLANLNLPSPTLSEIITQTAEEWHRLRLARNHRLQDLLESFFDWRRSGS